MQLDSMNLASVLVLDSGLEQSAKGMTVPLAQIDDLKYWFGLDSSVMMIIGYIAFRF